MILITPCRRRFTLRLPLPRCCIDVTRRGYADAARYSLRHADVTPRHA